MEDYKIVDLYWMRSETAISETDAKYGRMLKSISYSLLSSMEDSEECVNDTYMAAWQSMPQERPTYLGAFLSKIVRRISISRFRHNNSQNRGAGQIIGELSECVPSTSSVEADFENGRLKDTLNSFIYGLDERKRSVFIRRYFYSQSIEQISLETGIKIGSVKSILARLRESLKKVLTEGNLL